MRQVMLIEFDEWGVVEDLAQAGREFVRAADEKKLAGAVNRETEQGKQLLVMIKTLIDATKAFEEMGAEEDTGS